MNRLKTPHIVTLVAALFVIAYLVLLRFPVQSHADRDVVAQAPRATRTSTPTMTPVPPTDTPVPPTATPTYTPVPPTDTPVPPTATPTETPAPPTDTPAPTRVAPTATPRPPTATPVSVQVLTSIELPNVEGGNGTAVVNYESWGNLNSEYYVTGNDGHRYRCEIGFLSQPEAVKRIQDYWSYAQRGGGAWSWIIRMRYKPGWMGCGSDVGVCWEGKENGAQMQVNSEIYIKDWAWQSLLNDHLAGGWAATTRNTHYAGIQRGLFKYVIDIDPPDIPVIGFKFTRVD